MEEKEFLFPDDPGCLTLPEDMAEATDFKADEAIKLDYDVKLPNSFSLGKWIYKTSNQGALGSCTAMWTTHWTQILIVRKNWEIPTTKNILTPEWKYLWWKMWHSTTKYDGWDYVEKAINTALKEWILIEENWKLARFDWYATEPFTADEAWFDKMKRYIYQWDPIVWCIRWDKQTRAEMREWEVKTVPEVPTGWHCIALVGWDESWFWFINSRSPNDWKELKSRFHISYNMMKKLKWKFNYRYRILYIKEEAKIDPERLKKINVYTVVLEVLKKYYNTESPEIQAWIVALSQPLRKVYPEINEKLPL